MHEYKPDARARALRSESPYVYRSPMVEDLDGALPEKQTARLAVERRKKGKLVTIVRGLAADENDLPRLLGKLKAACGAGGTLKHDSLEIQGNHLERVRELLAEIGYRVSG